jgi:RimJ/RimL family protein N-acetyltransferase
MIIIRAVTEHDAADLLALRLQLDRETRFMMLEPDERDADPIRFHAELRDVVASARHAIIVAAHAERALVGYVEAERGQFRRNRHSATLALGVLQAYHGQGIARRLLQALEGWAEASDVQRLELTVMVHNHAAYALYTRMGFTVEGRRQRSLMVDGAFVDEYSMAKLLVNDDLAGDPAPP